MFYYYMLLNLIEKIWKKLNKIFSYFFGLTTKSKFDSICENWNGIRWIELHWNEWHFNVIFFTVFLVHKVTRVTLPLLSNEMVSSLITPFGDQVIFNEARAKLFKTKGTTNSKNDVQRSKTVTKSVSFTSYTKNVFCLKWCFQHKLFKLVSKFLIFHF